MAEKKRRIEGGKSKTRDKRNKRVVSEEKWQHQLNWRLVVLSRGPRSVKQEAEYTRLQKLQ